MLELKKPNYLIRKNRAGKHCIAVKIKSLAEERLVGSFPLLLLCKNYDTEEAAKMAIDEWLQDTVA